MEVLHVDADLALVDERLVVVEEVLDGILDRDDVGVARSVDVVEHGGDGRAFAGAGDAGQQDEALLAIGDILEDFGQAEFVEVANVANDAAGGDGSMAALAEAVDAEPVGAFKVVREVDGAVVEEMLALGGRQDFEDHLVDLLARERWLAGLADVAAEAEARRGAGLDVDIAGAELAAGLEKPVDLGILLDR